MSSNGYRKRSAAARVIDMAARSVRSGTLVLTDSSGTRSYGSGEPKVSVQVHDQASYSALLKHGSIGLARAYAAGMWDCDDLTGFVALLIRETKILSSLQDKVGQFSGTAGDWARRFGGPSPETDRKNIRAHYDLSNEFFSLMLDETMTYSAAVFEGPGTSLRAAQVEKMDMLCSKLDLGRGDQLLEIGTGWGGLAIHAAAEYGCRVTTTTISDAQFEFATRRVAEAGLSDLVKVLPCDYRELTGKFDKLVSVEMIEAVDWRRHDKFFETCARLLRPDGLMALQAITIEDGSYERAKNGSDFVTELIFPGGCVPSVRAILRSVSRSTPLEIIDLEDIGRHYAETLSRWHLNVEAHRDQISALGFDQAFLRTWDLYLCYCEAAFLERHVSDVQIVMAMPQWRAPLVKRAR
jgi:cyclopropane-fatty-acyl-phospholipid synthase